MVRAAGTQEGAGVQVRVAGAGAGTQVMVAGTQRGAGAQVRAAGTRGGVGVQVRACALLGTPRPPGFVLGPPLISPGVEPLEPLFLVVSELHASVCASSTVFYF